jgi:hypothetical protein
VALGPLLIERNLLEPHQLEAALEHQKVARCSLIVSVLALGFLSQEELDAVLGEAPPAPESIAETGLELRFLLALVLKTIYMTGVETSPKLSRLAALPEHLVDEVLADAREKKLLEVLGLADERRSIYRYALTDAGRTRAVDALEQCHYIGPAPVPLGAYRSQAARQTIARDQVGPESMARALSHLVLPSGLVDQLGPAANSGKTVLLYGAPGNGKTSIAEALGRAFEQPIHVPHCLEIGGQIVRLFDPAVHEPWEEAELETTPGAEPDSDRRWVKCRRPVILTGGELTIEMLDLSFDPISKFYEAPAHVKANGGVFVIDDFGRQRVRSTDLLNRWILPLERRSDLLTLHTGKKVEVPFDQLRADRRRRVASHPIQVRHRGTIARRLRGDPPAGVRGPPGSHGRRRSRLPAGLLLPGDRTADFRSPSVLPARPRARALPVPWHRAAPEHGARPRGRCTPPRRRLAATDHRPVIVP